MKRVIIAGIALVGGLEIAAHYPNLAWLGFLLAASAYFIAPGRKSKSRSRN